MVVPAATAVDLGLADAGHERLRMHTKLVGDPLDRALARLRVIPRASVPICVARGYRYVNVHEDPSSVSLTVEINAIQAVQGVAIPLPPIGLTGGVAEATARLRAAAHSPAAEPAGTLRSIVKPVSRLASEAHALEGEIAAQLPSALGRRLNGGFDETGFASDPTAFAAKLVGLRHLVGEPDEVLRCLDAQPWRGV